MRLLVRSGVRFHLRRRAQLLLCVSGVALGVAVVAAMWLAIDAARRGFDLSNEAIFGRVTHTLEGATGTLDDALYPLLRTQLREVTSAPVVEGPVRVEAANATLTLMGVDPFAESSFRSQSPGPRSGDLIALLTRPGTVLASAGTARRLGIAPGHHIQALAAGRTVTLELLALLPTASALDEAGLDDVLVADIATAQEVLGRIGTLSRIDLGVPAVPAREAAALDGLRALLPAGVRVQQAGARAHARTQMTRAFYLNLRMLSLLALLVGLFVIYNAMTFAVVQRRALIGTLRAVGVTGREILVMVLAEAAILGAVATAVGLPLGLLLARRLTDLVTRTVDDLYFRTAVREIALAPETLLVPVALGILGAMVAALPPALEATGIPPRAVLTASHPQQRAHAAVPRLAGAAVCAALLGLVLLAAPDGGLGAAFGALFLLVAVACLLAPAATLGLASLLQRVVRIPAGVTGAMAVRGVRSGLARSAVAITALMVALATTLGVAIMVASFRASLQDWLSTTLAADVYVGIAGRDAQATLPADLVRRAEAVPGVRAASRSRDVDVATQFGEVWLKAVSLDGTLRHRELHLLDGESAPLWRALGERDAVAVSEPFASRHALVRGSQLRLHTTAGERSFTVAGVFRDYASDRGMLLMGLARYRAWFADPGVSSVGLQLAEGADTAVVTAALRAISAPGGLRVRVRDHASLRAASLQIFDRTFAITRVLQWLATLVACFGVLSALMALALERSREMAVLRAHGLTRRELFGLMQIQTASMGLIAGILALPLGALMALVLVHVINRRAFGWGMDFHLPPEALAHTLLVALLAALAAGIYPAWRMAATTPAQALREA